MQEIKCKHDQMVFLFEMGDWPSAFIKIMRKREKEVASAQLEGLRERLKEKLEEEGLATDKERAAKDDIDKKIDASCKWRLLQGVMAEDSHPMITREVKKVRKWEADPSPTKTPPQTPALDRFKALCDDLSVNFEFGLQVLKLTKERNFAAHHPPPRIKNHIQAGRVNWDAIKKSCEDLRLKLRKDRDDGSLDNVQLELFEMHIDAWLSLYIKKWDDSGHHQETTLGANATSAGSTEPVHPPPISPHEDNKWGYLAGVSCD